MPKSASIPNTLKKVVESNSFQYFILGVIVAAAVLVGAETYPSVKKEYHGLLQILDGLILFIFVVEAGIKMAQHGTRFYRYFHDPWNVFDFTIVAVCLIPGTGSFAAVLRLARVMRALRLMTAMPNLQVIVGALIKSIPSMGYVGIVLALNFYVYAVMGVYLFSENDPVHFKDLQTGMLSLFRVVTLEDWTDIMYINMYGSNNYPGPTLEAYENANNTGIVPKFDLDDPQRNLMSPMVGWMFFVSFVMFGTMIMLNLFIGVIINSMDEARAEREREQLAHQRASGKGPTIEEEMNEIDHQMESLKEKLHLLRVHFQLKATQSGSSG